MLVTLYTSRIVLNTLGIEDYGIYNAVGGIIFMFGIISGALSNAISRYITYEIGKSNVERLKLIFCTSVSIQIIISIVVLIVCEIIGLWFLNNKMSIPADRLIAANWVLHFSLLTFVVNLISVPYNACIIAHEQMNVYAFISIFDAVLRLVVAYLLIISTIDKLIIYAVLLFIASLCVRLVYGFYCKRCFEECRYKFKYDKGLFKEMLCFAGWNFFSNGASVLNAQGVNLLINVFFGVVANSARGIATQVETAVHQFVVTFTTAINPQIIKSFALNEKQRMFNLICKGAKFSYLLLLIFALPIIIEADKILEIWLINVPPDSSLFVRLSILGTMVTILGNSGYTACMATGKIKNYSIWTTALGSFVFILTWVAYKIGCPVQTTYIVYIIIYILIQVVRLIIMRELLSFPITKYIKEVVLPIAQTTAIAFILPVFVVAQMPSSNIRVFTTIIVSVVWTSGCAYLLALTKGEKNVVRTNIKSILVKIAKR